MPITPDSEGTRRVIMVICTAAAGIWFGILGLDSMRTGIPVPGNAKYNFPMDGWMVALMAAFLVFLGFCVIGVGLGYITLKGQG